MIFYPLDTQPSRDGALRAFFLIRVQISISEIHKLIPQVMREFDIELLDRGIEWTTNNMWFNKQTEIQVKVRRRVYGRYGRGGHI